MELILRAEANESREVEITRMTFKSKHQSPLIMVIKEYWFNGEVVFAKVLWDISLPKLNRPLKSILINLRSREDETN